MSSPPSFCTSCQSSTPIFAVEAFVKAHCAYFQRGSVSDALFVGCELVHKCLRDHDPELCDRLVAAKLPVQFVLSSVMTFSADSPPLREVVSLWDYMFATGTHLNVFLITARLMLARATLLQPTNVTKMLGKDLPRVNDANAVIALATQLYLRSSRKLIDRCKRHATASGSSGSTPPTPTPTSITTLTAATSPATATLTSTHAATLRRQQQHQQVCKFFSLFQKCFTLTAWIRHGCLRCCWEAFVWVRRRPAAS
jgi:hypothetical protein